MVYGYTRVSNNRQDMTRQRSDILEAANKAGLIVEDWIEETISSRTEDREMLRLVQGLREGDIVMVTELSRIGRSLREIDTLVKECRSRRASIFTTKNGQRLGAGMDVAAQAMALALDIGAQIESDLISERTKSGLMAARTSGKRLGRPAGVSRLDALEPEIRKYLNLGVDKANVARIVGCSRSILHRWLSRHPEILQEVVNPRGDQPKNEKQKTG
jgi:DNA invertase Pin-like site-specific DNA recombinase